MHMTIFLSFHPVSRVFYNLKYLKVWLIIERWTVYCRTTKQLTDNTLERSKIMK